MIVARESYIDTVVVIHDTSDCIEAEAIHLILCQIPGKVRQQES